MDDFSSYRSGRMSARTLQRRQGVGMTTQAFARDQDRQEDILESARAAARRNRQERILASIEEGGKTVRTGMEQGGQTIRQGMAGEVDRYRADMDWRARNDVANLQMNAQVQSAQIGADASMSNTRTQARSQLLNTLTAGWMNKGIEKLKQTGETARQQLLTGQSGFQTAPDGGNVFVDPTGKAIPVPGNQQQQPGATPIWEPQTGRFLGYQVQDGTGKAEFREFKPQRNPYDSMTDPARYEQFEKTFNTPPPMPSPAGSGNAAAAGAKAPATQAANRFVDQRPPVDGAVPTKDGNYEFVDSGGTRRKLRYTAEGWQVNSGNDWKFITR
jgi:hypothetical protein